MPFGSLASPPRPTFMGTDPPHPSTTEQTLVGSSACGLGATGAMCFLGMDEHGWDMVRPSISASLASCTSHAVRAHGPPSRRKQESSCASEMEMLLPRPSLRYANHASGMPLRLPDPVPCSPGPQLCTLHNASTQRLLHGMWPPLSGRGGTPRACATCHIVTTAGAIGHSTR